MHNNFDYTYLCCSFPFIFMALVGWSIVIHSSKRVEEIETPFSKIDEKTTSTKKAGFIEWFILSCALLMLAVSLYDFRIGVANSTYPPFRNPQGVLGLIVLEIGLIAWINIILGGLPGWLHPSNIAHHQRKYLIASRVITFVGLLLLFYTFRHNDPSAWVHVDSILIQSNVYNLAAIDHSRWDEDSATYMIFECDASGVKCSFICASPSEIRTVDPANTGELRYDPTTNELLAVAWDGPLFEVCRYQPELE